MADSEIEEVVGSEPQLSPLQTLRHSAAHVMADAVKRLFPEAKVTIGPAIETGFYYDFDMPRPFTEEDLGRIEGEMRKIVDADHRFERVAMSRDEARRLFAGMGEKYKVEILDAIPESATITVYRSGEFVDLCRGPHVESTGKIKAFKLLSVAGAYWRGDERNPMLQRIYGTAFGSQKELDEHLHRIEESKKRDHRKLGKELDLFSIDETIGGGLVLWHPKGARVRYLAEQFWREEHFRNGYEVVYSPHVARETLWNISGHTGFYRENMFSGLDVEGQKYLVKPMNCPYHIEIFKHGLRSYRELPLRLAELGTVYRYERSGVLHGLLRVRGFTQDDAHLFMRRDQLAEELKRTLDFCLYILRTFGFTDFKLYLATRPKESIGETELWEEAEKHLFDALKVSGLEYEIDAGGGAFYGPKIDLKLRDAIGREWQCSTIQVDFMLPERFDLTYVGQDGAKHRAVMVHRALYGSLERFFAVLIEHYAGAFPLWLAPVQARVCTISEKQEEWARTVEKTLVEKGFRVDMDLSPDKVGPKTWRAKSDKIPVTLVVGQKEMDAGKVAPRLLDGKQLEPMTLDAFVEWITKAAAVPRGGAVVGSN
jgi:threonyl-tRNA synthetase